MSATRRSALLVLLVGAVLLFAFVQVARAVDFTGAAWSRFRDPASSIAMLATTRPAAQLPAVNKLVCFKCHNFERYRAGAEFAHAGEHAKVGHCHLCHAFEGHLQLTVRESTCEHSH